MKFYLLIISMFLLVHADAITFLFENKEYIQSKISLCEPSLTRDIDTTNPQLKQLKKKCQSSDLDVFNYFCQRQKSEWINRKEEIFLSFTTICKMTANFPNIKGNLVNDEVFVEALILMLAEDSRYANLAVSRLVQMVPFSFIEDKKSLVAEKVNNSPISLEEKTKLLIYSNPSDSIKQMLLSDSARIKLPLVYRAKLGEDSSITVLKNNFEQAINVNIDSLPYSLRYTPFEKVSKLAEDLIFTGDTMLTKLVLSNFNKQIFIFHEKRNCAIASIRDNIIKSLQKYHPSEELLNEKYLYFKGLTFAGSKASDPIRVGKYLQEICDWIGLIYNIEVIDPIGRRVFSSELCR